MNAAGADALMTPNQWLVLLAGVIGLGTAAYELYRRYQRWKGDPNEENEQAMDRMVRLTLVFAVLATCLWLGITEIQFPSE